MCTGCPHPSARVRECGVRTAFYLPCLCTETEQCGSFAPCLGTHSSCSVHWASQWRLLRVRRPWGLWEELCGKWAFMLLHQVTPKPRWWRCWKFIPVFAVQMLSSVLAAFVGILGSGYCVIVSALGLSHGPYCFTHLERSWIYPFTESSGG